MLSCQESLSSVNVMPKYFIIGPFGVSNSVKSEPMSTSVAGDGVCVSLGAVVGWMGRTGRGEGRGEGGRVVGIRI